MSDKEQNSLPTIWDIIDRMEFKWLFGEEKKIEEPKKKRKYTKRSKKKS